MASFKKKNYTEPVICQHNNDLSKDWYVFFRFKYEGKVYRYKRREGINRIKDLNDRLNAIDELREEISYDLKHGWCPITDHKREVDYNPYLRIKGDNNSPIKQIRNTKKQTEEQLINKYYLKGL